MGLQAYEDDLCSCGWPRTYTMHKEARGHWSSTKAHHCYACEARGRAETGASKNAGDKQLHGYYFSASPDEGMFHAMADPILDYEDLTSNPGGDPA